MNTRVRFFSGLVVSTLFISLLYIFRKKHDLKSEDVTQSQVDDLLSFSFSKQVNRIIINKLANEYKHLPDLQVRSLLKLYNEVHNNVFRSITIQE